MKDTKKPVRLADVGELEENLYEALEVSARKVDSDDVITCGEAISCEIEDLKQLPTIDPESLRPVAHWDMEEDAVGDPIVWTCSNCKDSIIMYDGATMENGYKYCPYCGARMEDVQHG